MIDSMIEKVARAMWRRETERAMRRPPSLPPEMGVTTSDWDQCSEIWKDRARAAIAAMRALPWPDDAVNAVLHGNTDPVPIYQGLIDDALKE